MSVPASYFERLYRRDGDPWAFRTRWYEARKRAVTLAALPRERYGTAFEPGCSIGALTAGLAARCDHLVAMDVSAAALETAGATLPAGVELVCGSVPAAWPTGHFDLIVISELAYYFDVRECQALCHLAVSSAEDLVAVHWRYSVEGYPLSGNSVHEMMHEAAADGGMERIASHDEADFRLDVWSHDERSVAQRTAVPGS